MEGNNNKAKSGRWLVPTSLILILVAILALLLFALHGETVVTGGFEGHIATETLVCESEQVGYPFFKYDNSDTKSLKVNVILEDGKLGSISLFYKLNYSSKEDMKRSEAVNHGAMNLSFYDNEMEADDLDAKYSFVDNSLQMSIYAKGDEITEKTSKYFMLDKIYDINRLDKEKMVENYNNVGLKCTIKLKSKEEVNENQ